MPLVLILEGEDDLISKSRVVSAGFNETIDRVKELPAVAWGNEAWRRTHVDGTALKRGAAEGGGEVVGDNFPIFTGGVCQCHANG